MQSYAFRLGLIQQRRLTIFCCLLSWLTVFWALQAFYLALTFANTTSLSRRNGGFYNFAAVADAIWQTLRDSAVSRWRRTDLVVTPLALAILVNQKLCGISGFGQPITRQS